MDKKESGDDGFYRRRRHLAAYDVLICWINRAKYSRPRLTPFGKLVTLAFPPSARSVDEIAEVNGSSSESLSERSMPATR
ncbi:hypothetical protein OAS86_01370 [Gammaproteobacteria bacterium]|nr:hypothetical protein [Gammaproteobacteria bacterium]